MFWINVTCIPWDTSHPTKGNAMKKLENVVCHGLCIVLLPVFVRKGKQVIAFISLLKFVTVETDLSDLKEEEHLTSF